MVEMAKMYISCKKVLLCKNYMYEDKGTDNQHMKVKTVKDNNLLADFYKAMSFKLTELSKQNRGKRNT